MKRVLKDLPFTVAYLDDIIIYSKITEEHLSHLQQVFHKLQDAKLSMALRKCLFLLKKLVFWPNLEYKRHKTHPIKKEAITFMKSPNNANKFRLSWVFWAITENLSKISLAWQKH